jgi:hypothetical protein
MTDFRIVVLPAKMKQRRDLNHGGSIGVLIKINRDEARRTAKLPKLYEKKSDRTPALKQFVQH